MKALLSILLLSFTLFLLGCHKKKPPQPQLPPETQVGAGTFGCKINGQIDTANYADNFGAYTVYEYINNRGYFTQIVGFNDLEFIRRFDRHILPRGFVRIRHYGILSSTAKKGCAATTKGQLP